MHQRHIYNKDELLFLPNTSGYDDVWFSCDREDQFLQNQDRLDSIYLDNPEYIRYKMNRHGYRTDELANFSDDFFVVMGCSYTVGEGLAEHDRWSDRLAGLCGLKCMNLGISGAGIDVLLANTLQYLKSPLPQPKFVVLQHPEVARTQHWFKEDPVRDTVFSELLTGSETAMADLVHELTKDLAPAAPKDSDGTNRRDLTKLITAAYNTEFFNRYWTSSGVPVIHWSFTGDADVINDYKVNPDIHITSIPNDFPDVDWPGDLARDCAHDGIESNKQVANILYKHFIEDLI